jgi:hypothetical protein
MVTPILRQLLPANRAGRRIALARRAWLTLSLIALSCGDAGTPAPPEQGSVAREERTNKHSYAAMPLLVGNQLRNPGFEAGTKGWVKPGRRSSISFEIANEPVHSGDRSARLVASWQPGDNERPVSVRSATQEISPARFPDRIAGWYRVDRWEDAPDESTLQLQILVAAFGDPRTREIVKPDDFDDPAVHAKLENFQLRYQLAGPTEEPEDGANVKNQVIGKGPPDLGSWVRFDLPVKPDFEQHWGVVPANYQYLRVMFAVRWDDKEEGAALHADVYYDDLFFGFEDL